MTPPIRRSMAGIAAGLMLVSLLVAPAAAGDRKTLAGSKPAWAKSANLVGHAKATDSVGFRIYLGWRNAADAEAKARAVSDPKSASYGKYLSSAEFRKQFAPSQGQVGNVQAWLKGQGFDVGYTPGNNHYVVAEGTVAQAEQAFDTTINRYKVNGKVVRSPSKAISVPSSLTLVDGVIGLDDSWLFMDPRQPDAPPPNAFVNAPPCSTYWAEKMATDRPARVWRDAAVRSLRVHAHPAPERLWHDRPHRVGHGWQSARRSRSSMPSPRRRSSPMSTLVDPQWPADHEAGPAPASRPPRHLRPAEQQADDPSGWYDRGDARRRGRARHGPRAKVVYVAAPNARRDLDAALNHVIDRHLAQIVTNSYGYATELLPPGYVKPINDMLVQAAATGIGVYFASGDAGDEAIRSASTRSNSRAATRG